MNLSSFAVVIGVLSCLCSIFLSAILITDLVKFDKRLQENKQPLASVGNAGSAWALLMISLIFNLGMCVVSVLMVAGVKKKRHVWMGPWVIVCAIDIIWSILHFFLLGFQRPHGDIILSLVYIALSCLLWYPVYTLWIVMRNENVSNVPQRRPETHAPQYDAMPVNPIEVAKLSDYTPQSQKA